MKGITVYVQKYTELGTDGFNVPIGRITWEEVEDVLVGEPSTDDITTSMDMYGKRIAYMLGIPKGDTHEWKDTVVKWTDAYGTEHKARTFGVPITGIEANIPTRWHKKVRCEAYE